MNRLRLLFFAFFSIAMLSACPDWKSIGEGFGAIEIGGSSGSEEVPGEEVPGEEIPGEEIPGEEIPGEIPGEEIPGEEIPGEEIPGEEIPGEEIPGEEIPNSSHKVQLRLRFDITDSSGGLWKEDDFTHVTGLEFQYDAFGTTASGYLINGAERPEGYIANYGFCGKYGITDSSMFWDKRDVARYKSGIDYYIGDESLYVMSQSAGTTTAVVYLIFFYVPAHLYARENVEFTVDWEGYDSQTCDPVALFHLNVTDRVWSASFEGFQPRTDHNAP